MCPDMQRTPTVPAMVQSSCGAIILMSMVVVLVLPVATTSAYALEREATVELLPNDLVSEDREQEVTNKAIATPKQVIEHQVAKTWRTIIRQMLDETRTSIKQKRTLTNQTQSITTLVALLMICLKAGLLPQLSNPMAGLGAPNPVAVSSLTSPHDQLHSVPDTVSDIIPGSLLGDVGTGDPLHSLHGGSSLVHSAPDTLTGGGLVSEYGGSGLVSETKDHLPVDAGHVTGIVEAPAAVVPSNIHDLPPTNLVAKPSIGRFGL